MKQRNSLALILKNGIELNSSGTTGSQKKIYQSPSKLKNANKVSRDCQKISSKSKIYTVCKMEHAGGLLAQTLPAFEIGANIDIEKFNAYKFCKKINNYTHTHLTPNHAKAIRLTKSFKNIDLKGVWITCGSEPVEWDLIIDFVKKGCNFMVNWGMTEIGPCAINTVFKNLESVLEYKKRAINGTLMGDKTYCDTKIENNTLHVKGNISVFKDRWFDTKDIVALNKKKEFYIQGRSK
jgi:acyl-CoA synthetase (AMP-forming)/AMP-acid ligase II